MFTRENPLQSQEMSSQCWPTIWITGQHPVSTFKSSSSHGPSYTMRVLLEEPGKTSGSGDTQESLNYEHPPLTLSTARTPGQGLST